MNTLKQLEEFGRALERAIQPYFLIFLVTGVTVTGLVLIYKLMKSK